MKNLILFGMICLLISCKGTKNASSATEVNSKSPTETFVIEDIIKDPTPEALNKRYPNAGLREDTGLFEEGTAERAYTILYPGTKNEIHLIWETIERKNLYQVVFSKNGDWVSSLGIGIGTPYAELVERNGKDIKVYGFGWDYSGAVDWNGGKLQNSNLRVFLKPAVEPNPKFYTDGIIKPTQAELDQLKLTVGNIIYHVGND